MEFYMKEEEKIPSKVVAIFESLIRLRDSGSDLSKIKVADIAKEAGIGKGTIYEYFSSKEEIIMKSVVFEYCKEFITLQTVMKKAKDFDEKLNLVLDWLSANVQKAFLMIQKIQKDETQNSGNSHFCRELMGVGVLELMDELAENLLECGISEGKIQAPANRMERDMILSGMAASFMCYISHKDIYKENSYEEAENCAKRILLSSLSK
ncbi:MAG: helix-turn-helix domain-containing protein [Acetivibrio sp.]